MKFLVPRRDRLPADAVERAYLSGIDEVPWPSRTRWTDDGLVIERAASDSGNFFIPLIVPDHGEVVLSTASLMERPEPYHLPVELARGTLNRLRNQVAGWQLAGLTVPEPIREPMAQAREHFAAAATGRHDPQAAADRAEAATRLALTAIDTLARLFAEQALAARKQQSGKLATLLGCNLGTTLPGEPMSRAIARACNTAAVPLVWRNIESSEGKRDWSLADAQIEWCREHGLKVASGPLLTIDKWSLPDWMYLWGVEDSENFHTCVAEHIDAVVSRYRGKVQLWQCASRLNIKNDFDHDEEQRLRLAVLSIAAVRRADPRTPVVITIDQPWGAFMSRQDYDLSPLQFVDALVRADLGLAGIGLEIHFGYPLVGTEPRDVLEFSRQMDRFSMLGLPLLVVLTVPSSLEPDPQACLPARPINYSRDAGLSVGSQRAWGEEYLSVLLAKQSVQGILWNQLTDSAPHMFAHGGLFDAEDRPKPIVEWMQSLRGQYVM